MMLTSTICIHHQGRIRKTQALQNKLANEDTNCILSACVGDASGPEDYRSVCGFYDAWFNSKRQRLFFAANAAASMPSR